MIDNLNIDNLNLSSALQAEFLVESPQAMHSFAASLAKKIRPGDVIALYGEMGTGKTTFAQGFIGNFLSADEKILSPSFTLLNIYDTPHSWRIFHADLYRLRDALELTELGLEEAFAQHVSLIEWPELAEHILPQNALKIQFEYVSENVRRLTEKK